MLKKWLVLTATLPTNPSGLRVRVWRSLKATGAGTLREGVYVLPEHASTAPALWALERTIAEAGAQAHMLVVEARDDVQERTFCTLFDRSEHYTELLQTIKEARAAIRKSTEVQLHKLLRGLDQQLQSIQANDFFPGKESQKAKEAMAALRREVELHLSPDEPGSIGTVIQPLNTADYQRRIWATRQRPWVDRLGTAWLVKRFVDKQPTFIWLSEPKKCPKSALGYDFDGAAFTHVDGKVTFEVVAQSFGLLKDPALQRLAGLVHYIDIGGIPADEAPGFEMLIRGLQAQHADDDALLAAALPAFDAYYAAMQVSHDH
ncbi:chromate resistance protein ChrB domain-containing protein [Giesbergeria anulus]|uniref:Chromate resistance exported protein n=1 Tax=Giesbergeria anulus TaxID=180197 RepID=A0A1H9PXB3_9BURK|nr:chromate resistance protein ChrB domain-containing protein [Giesbergeria anulus]SER52824.1 hypothetical protein SAMN02982919_02554 [Giesbergeria anulus]